jgi:hypothetical protein
MGDWFGDINVSFHGHILGTESKWLPSCAVQVEGKRWTLSGGWVVTIKMQQMAKRKGDRTFFMGVDIVFLDAHRWCVWLWRLTWACLTPFNLIKPHTAPLPVHHITS